MKEKRNRATQSDWESVNSRGSCIRLDAATLEFHFAVEDSRERLILLGSKAADVHELCQSRVLFLSVLDEHQLRKQRIRREKWYQILAARRAVLSNQSEPTHWIHANFKFVREITNFGLSAAQAAAAVSALAKL